MKIGFSTDQTIVLVGMMGVGKTSVGRKLAKQLNMPFFDSDQEVELAAGSTISDIYEIYGEQAFKDTEYRVIKRLIETERPHILSTGVGAFANEKSRQLIKANTISVWIKADIEKIIPRVTKRSHRPQLQNRDTEEAIKELNDMYSEHYAEADVIAECNTENSNLTIGNIIRALNNYSSGVSS